MLHRQPLAIVDVETTGTRSSVDRVTEIAVLEIDGFELRCLRIFKSLGIAGRKAHNEL